MFCNDQLCQHKNILSLTPTSIYRAPTNDLFIKFVDLKTQILSQASNSRRKFDVWLKIWACRPNKIVNILILGARYIDVLLYMLNFCSAIWNW